MKLFGITVPKGIERLCQPALLYLFLTIISSTFYFFAMIRLNNDVKINGSDVTVHDYTFMGFIFKLLISVFWIFFLNYLCKYKMGKKIAWVIVLLPFFFMGLMLIGVMCALSFIALQTEKTKSLQRELNIERKKLISDDKPSEKPSFGSQNGNEYKNSHELMSHVIILKKIK